MAKSPPGQKGHPKAPVSLAGLSECQVFVSRVSCRHSLISHQQIKEMRTIIIILANVLHTVSGTSRGPGEEQKPLPVLGTALASPPELSKGTKRHQMQSRKHKTDCKYLEMGIQKNY